MKRKILSLLFVALSTVIFTSFAQNTENDTIQTCNNKHKNCCKFKGKGKHHKMGHLNPFEGITLSDTQKEQLKNLHKKRHNEIKEFHNKATECDSCKIKSPREMRRQQLDEIKSILTPEQYVQYLENSVVNQTSKHIKKPHKRPHHKHNKQKEHK